MKKIYFLITLICFVFCGAEPDRPTDLSMVRGVNPQNDLAGYQLHFFTNESSGDSLEVGIEVAAGDLVWTRFRPPTRWSETDTGAAVYYPDHIIDIPNIEVIYSQNFGVWSAEFSFLVAISPGDYLARLLARSTGGAKSGLSDPVIIRITGGQ